MNKKERIQEAAKNLYNKTIEIIISDDSFETKQNRLLELHATAMSLEKDILETPIIAELTRFIINKIKLYGVFNGLEIDEFGKLENALVVLREVFGKNEENEDENE